MVTVPPIPLVRLTERLRNRLYRIHQNLAPAPVVMLEMILAAWTSQAIEVVAELGIADALAAGPLTGDDLARKVGADPDALSRLMRALISRGVFRQLPDGAYALNPLADTLRTDSPVSMAGAAMFYGSRQHREHWSMLAESIRTGTASVPMLRGKGFFDYLSDDRQLARLFNDAMTSISEMAEHAVVAAYDFTRCREIVDVGGGQGRLLAAILSSAPTARGVLYDMPDVVAAAPELLRKLDVSERVRVEGGSFFDSVPSGADMYVLKHIVHDWPDDEAAAILRNARAAMDAEARILLVELVIPQHGREFMGKWADLEMLLGVNGRERTAAEYRRLLERSGFRMTRVVPTVSPFSLVEAVPVE